MSLAVILLAGSALLIRTFLALYAVDRGFAAHSSAAGCASAGVSTASGTAISAVLRDAIGWVHLANWQ